MPTLRSPDQTLAFLRGGYSFIGSCCHRFRIDAFYGRLLGRRTLFLGGPQAVELFYAPGASPRAGGLPASAVTLLQDRGSVQQLEGAAHPQHRDLFVRLGAAGEADRKTDVFERHFTRPGPLAGRRGHPAARRTDLPARARRPGVGPVHRFRRRGAGPGPARRERFRGDDPTGVHHFAQKVRRTTPFFPVIAGVADRGFSWDGTAVPAGTRTVADVYGTTMDPRSWPAPRYFDPRRFPGRNGVANHLVPHGRGDIHASRRCPGEYLTLALLERAIVLLSRANVHLSAQDLSVSMTRMPALPANRSSPVSPPPAPGPRPRPSKDNGWVRISFPRPKDRPAPATPAQSIDLSGDVAVDCRQDAGSVLPPRRPEMLWRMTMSTNEPLSGPTASIPSEPGTEPPGAPGPELPPDPTQPPTEPQPSPSTVPTTDPPSSPEPPTEPWPEPAIDPIVVPPEPETDPRREEAARLQLPLDSP